MKEKMKLLSALLVVFFISSCSETSDVIREDKADFEVEKTGRFISNPKNLNIIYFVPTDNPAKLDYKQRISEMFINYQGYVLSQMTRAGYIGKTFGLPLDSVTGGVKIITIQGKYGSAKYPYKGGSVEVETEVKEYQKLHPEEFSSDFHNFIILPAQANGGDVPYSGYGRWAFGIDLPFLKVSEISTNRSTYFGGNLHELLHGLGLDHESPLNSVKSQLGNTLMGTGNETWGKSPTYISDAFCAILSQNEIFQTTARPDNYYNFNSSIKLSKKLFNMATKEIELEGAITSEKEISDVIVEIRRKGAGAGEYISPWRAILSNLNFSIKIPVNELPNPNATYNFTVRLIGKNGTTIAFSESFNRIGDSMSFNERLSIFEHGSYTGKRFDLAVGEYRKTDLEKLNIPDNWISSLKVPLGYEVIVYDGNNFDGTNVKYAKSSSNLGSFNDKISSIKVFKIY